MKKSIALVMAMVFVLALAGCGGGGDSAGAQVGDWKMISMEQGGVSTDLSQLEAVGITGMLKLTDDKKATLEIAGQTLSGTWEAKGDNGVALTFEFEGESSTAEGTITDGKLTLEQDGEKMVFEKSTGTDASPATT